MKFKCDHVLTRAAHVLPCAICQHPSSPRLILFFSATTSSSFQTRPVVARHVSQRCPVHLPSPRCTIGAFSKCLIYFSDLAPQRHATTLSAGFPKVVDRVRVSPTAAASSHTQLLSALHEIRRSLHRSSSRMISVITFLMQPAGYPHSGRRYWC